MPAEDVTGTPEWAFQKLGRSGLRSAQATAARPSYVVTDLDGWFDERKFAHIRIAVYHPQTEGKSERRFDMQKIRILREDHNRRNALQGRIEVLVEHNDHRRRRESIDDLSRRMSTSGRDAPNYCNEKGSDETPSNEVTGIVEPWFMKIAYWVNETPCSFRIGFASISLVTDTVTSRCRPRN